jgi:hypothetical protein
MPPRAHPVFKSSIRLHCVVTLPDTPTAAVITVAFVSVNERTMQPWSMQTQG